MVQPRPVTGASVGVFAELELPIVQAPMAGGPSTPALAVAVSEAGGLGFLAAGYLDRGRLREQIEATRERTSKPFGVNLFVGGGGPADTELVRRYAEVLAPVSGQAGVELGTPRFDDDGFDEKLGLVLELGIRVVSFTFGLPPGAAVRRLRDAGSEVWATVTSPDEARAAAAHGADVLVVQGVEAGGHRGVFVDDDHASDLTLLSALQLIEREVDLPLVAAGGLATGAAVGAALVAGAVAAQIGTAYLRCPEAGTAEVHRRAVATEGPTVLTRAFSGRTARGVENRFTRDHSRHAPRAYPEVHHLTTPLRAHGRTVGDPDLVNLWAGETHALATERSAGEITRAFAAEARAAIERSLERLRPG